jgi:hypothetical protein
MAPSTYADQLRDAIRQSLFGPATADRENARASAQATAPVVWLLGKTGAGKTAIIAALTGDARAEIGLGFEPWSEIWRGPKRVAAAFFVLDSQGAQRAS